MKMARLSVVRTGRLYPLSFRGLVDPTAMVSGKSSDPIGNRNRTVQTSCAITTLHCGENAGLLLV